VKKGKLRGGGPRKREGFRETTTKREGNGSVRGKPSAGILFQTCPGVGLQPKKNQIGKKTKRRGKRRIFVERKTLRFIVWNKEKRKKRASKEGIRKFVFDIRRTPCMVSKDQGFLTQQGEMFKGGKRKRRRCVKGIIRATKSLGKRGKRRIPKKKDNWGVADD